MHDLIAVSKALADETRLRLLAACVHGVDAGLADDLCVCQLIELVGLAPSTVSRHLSILRDAGLLASRREGRWIYYRPVAPDENTPLAVRRTLDLIRESLRGDAALADDARSLPVILAIEPEELCRTQRPSPGVDSACCSSAPATPAEARWRKDGPGR